MNRIKKLGIGKMHILFILMACLFLLNCGSNNNSVMNTTNANSPETDSIKSEPNLSSDQADVSSIDGIINAIYDSITFSQGEKPDMARFRSLCATNAPFIRIRPDGVDKMDSDSFFSAFQERVETGALKSFYEGEIFRKTHQYGSLAQVFTTYEKGMNTDDPESFNRGINSIQLYHDGQRWWISCLMWEDESPENPIPDEYLR